MPDYGEVENTRSWSNANVYVAFRDAITGLFPDLPASLADEFDPADWGHVGLLDGGQGFTEATSETVTDTFAWGDILIASRTSDQKDTKTFTAFEINATTDRLRGIEDEGGGTFTQFRKVAEDCLVAFEKIDGAKTVTERQISANYAQIKVNGDRTETATNPQSVPFIATIFPGSDLALYTIQRGATVEVGS